MNIFQWNFIWNSNIFIQENGFENVVCEMAAIMSRGRWVNVNLCTHVQLITSHHINIWDTVWDKDNVFKLVYLCVCEQELQGMIRTRQIWGIWKLRPAYSPETPNLGQNRWCFVPFDLEIWWMTLENNRASLLCCFKLCATFHSHWWIQIGVTVRKRPIWVKFDDF